MHPATEEKIELGFGEQGKVNPAFLVSLLKLQTPVEIGEMPHSGVARVDGAVYGVKDRSRAGMGWIKRAESQS